MRGIVTMREIDQLRQECNEFVDKKRLLEPEHGMNCPYYLKTIKAIADSMQEINEKLSAYHEQENLGAEELLEKRFPDLNVSSLPEGYFLTQWEFACENDTRRNSFLEGLATITQNGTRKAILYKDYAPHSFSFDIPGHYNGGMIFHPIGSGTGAEAPIFSVTLNDAKDIWEIHT